MSDNDNQKARKERIQQVVNHIFNDDLMMALAAILASTVILESLFDLSEGMQIVFQYLNYFIITIFIAEYVVKLYIIDTKRDFIKDKTHIFDLIIILLALLDFSGIGYLPDQGQLSPILRLLRLLPRILTRMLLTFFLAGKMAEMKGEITKQPAPQGMKSSALHLNGTKENNILRCEDDIPIWMDFQNVKREDLKNVSKVTKIDQLPIENKLLRASFPRIDKVDNDLSLFLWDAQGKIGNDNTKSLKIVTNNMLIIFNERKIITMNSGENNMFEEVLKKKSSFIFSEKEFTDKILCLILRQKLEDYNKIVTHIEQETIEFEEIPVDKTSTKFLVETFHLKKDILKLSGNLSHFQKILDKLTKIDTIRSFGVDNSKEFIDLSEDSKYLYETAQNIKENLTSLIDLHTNSVDYEMNQVMKVIAVITCLAIIPATVGGLLGVNLQEGVFHIKFIEIFFIIISSMLLGIYAFFKMEWLK